MQGILINAFERRVEPISLDENVSVYHKSVNQALGSIAHDSIYSNDKTLQILFNPDCLMDDTNTAFTFKYMSRPLFGNVILIGRDPSTRLKVALDASITIESLDVKFFSEEETQVARIEAQDYLMQVRKGLR